MLKHVIQTLPSALLKFYTINELEFTVINLCDLVYDRKYTWNNRNKFFDIYTLLSVKLAMLKVITFGLQ